MTRYKNRRILLVDDNEDVHKDYESILVKSGPAPVDLLDAALFGSDPFVTAKGESYEVDSVYQGEEAVKKVKHAIEEGRPYAMAFVDMRMPPGWDGVRTIEEIWKIDPEVLIVVCTAYSDLSWEKTVDTLGNTDKILLLKKPFERPEVSQLASSITQKWEVTREATFKMSELEQIVEERTKDLRELNKSLEAAMRAKTDFLSSMSHEIRTPMTGIIGLTDLALELSQNPAQTEYLQSVLSSANSLLVIINDILDLSKVEAGKVLLVQEKFSLRAFVGKIENILSVRTKEKDIKFTTQVDATLPDILLGDEVRLGQILTNLIGNAVKFTSAGGAIELAITLDSSSDDEVMESVIVRFSVKDSGIGIAPEKLQSIFEPYTQAEVSTSRDYGGTGLGLTISKKLVEAMGGAIWVESVLGKGSTFSFTALVGKGDKGFTVLPQREEEHGKVVFKPLHVLLVEDNPVNQQLAKIHLERLGFSVIVAGNGKDALMYLCENVSSPFDLIFMDCQMPIMGGCEATMHIREKELKTSGHIPIIAMTARVMEGDKERCFAAGMDDYIAKPFMPSDLKEVLKRWAL